jgi:acetylornithine deacetylase
LADRLQSCARGVASDCQKVGVPYGTDASALSAAGVPCVVFGPGSIAQAHTVDEWLEVEQLHKASEILYQFVRSFD